MDFNNDSAKVVSEGYITYLYNKIRNMLKRENVPKEVRIALEKVDSGSLQAVIVEKLPAVGVLNTVYLIKSIKQNPSDHSYDEYVYISKSRYEYIGDSNLDQFPDNEYLHFHKNMSILNGFSESNGKLLYKGKSIGEASGSGDGSGDSSGGDSGDIPGSGEDGDDNLNLGDIIDDIWDNL